MKVLVTGGAGFIGSHIVDRLVARKDEVIVIDDLSRGKKENINPEADFFNTSITEPGIREVFEKQKPDCVIHQAAQVDVSRSLQDPIFDAKVNILGSLNVLENCRRCGVKKIVYGNSGGSGPGEPEYLPVDEGHPIRPLSPYGVSKHSVEHYLYLYSKLYGLDYVSLRYANVFGPRQDPFGEGGVVAIFFHSLISGNRPQIFGSGEQTRDFVFVDDVADANILGIQKGSGCFNVGTGKETSVNDLFAMIKIICGSKLTARHVEARKGEIMRSALNCDLIKQEIGWQPKTSLRDGLIKTFRFFKSG